MEQELTLKITNVLADPTRYSIYQYVSNNHRNVSVQDIAEEFHIHPNVARLHLSKLEDVGMLRSENQKTGKGGRPSRLYRLSDEVVELNFPFRDYRLLAKIALETMVCLGPAASNALYETGKRYGLEIMGNLLVKRNINKDQLSFNQKVELLKTSSSMLGLNPDIYIKEDNHKLFFQIFNCPFKEVASQQKDITCDLHIAFLKGLVEALFDNPFILTNVQNMMDGCLSCAYHLNISN
ncbi:helix-turn-helix domain-containing protein [Caldibacillus lycopersici]|uniref:Helix-turn-helix domain-containing protein n=1 Tax=Perspicuibacillus lycopersici TaxID=1325689 RepID=A0AAE3IUJ9_9BACI|nr:helix-turn-helix domain-containing protein [Perspicuibacillus lycopersici]MCU9613863.1 helix-turn-helix domain-containing protein [Perspicuibacillus lycopersici]